MDEDGQLTLSDNATAFVAVRTAPGLHLLRLGVPKKGAVIVNKQHCLAVAKVHWWRKAIFKVHLLGNGRVSLATMVTRQPSKTGPLAESEPEEEEDLIEKAADQESPDYETIFTDVEEKKVNLDAEVEPEETEFEEIPEDEDMPEIDEDYERRGHRPHHKRHRHHKHHHRPRHHHRHHYKKVFVTASNSRVCLGKWSRNSLFTVHHVKRNSTKVSEDCLILILGKHGCPTILIGLCIAMC